MVAEKRMLGDTGKGRLHVFGFRSFDLLYGERPIKSWMANIHLAPFSQCGGILYLTTRRLLFGPWTIQIPYAPRAWELKALEAIGVGRPLGRALSSLWAAKLWYVQVDGQRHYFQTYFRWKEWLEAISEATGLPVGGYDSDDRTSSRERRPAQ